MKFASSLSDGLVPEWADQYVNYKEGKVLIKKVKASKFDSRDNANSMKTSNDEVIENTEPQDDNEVTEDDSGNSIVGSHSERFIPQPARRRTSIFKFSTRSQKDSKIEPGMGKRRFISWLDSEYRKVETFYKEREQEVHERFLLLQDQLYQLRDHKASIISSKQIHATNEDRAYGTVQDFAYNTRTFVDTLKGLELPSLPDAAFLKKEKKKPSPNELTNLNDRSRMEDINYQENRIRNGVQGFFNDDNSDFESDNSSSNRIQDQVVRHVAAPEQTAKQKKQTNRREYTTKKQHYGVPYVYARKQLKEAVLKHYRALSLLKSYRDLNRTAFKKITKKFDKSMGTDLSTSYMDKIDNHSYFQTSDLLDKLVKYLEELFIAFYDPETTDKKHSLEKLKSIAYAINSNMKQPTYNAPLFLSGLLLGAGLPFFVLAVIKGLNKYFSGEFPQGRYLFQVWGGFFITDLVLLMFAVNFMVFDKFKINYKFIFEFDITTALDYRQFVLIPSIGFFVLSFAGWFSFHDFWPNRFPGTDWPWLFLGVMLFIFLWPGKQLYASSRRWLQIALWRILLSGFYPVEFRDFFIGDILCSMTYVMGNISFFFCLYSKQWGPSRDPTFSNPVCGSSRSRLVGFFSTLPSIFRLLQSIRRYLDTGDWFPHLANMSKYGVSVIYYALLSNYRIGTNEKNRIAFIVMAIINSLFTSSWDIVMDWSLLQSGSKHPYLRNNLFFKLPVYYYAAIILNIILRFQWIFYAFFSSQIQQSAVTSFFIAIAEITRRFIWIFFRMENEHCTNVILFRASKDSPLPYPTSSKVMKAIKKLVELRFYDNEDGVLPGSTDQQQHSTNASISSTATGSFRSYGRPDIESRLSNEEHSGRSLNRRKSTLGAISDTLQNAHIKDFQRRTTVAKNVPESDEDDDDDDFGQ